MSRLKPHLTLSVLATAVFLTGALLSGCSNDADSETAATVEADSDGFHGTLVTDPPLQIAPVTLRDTDGLPVRLDQRARGSVTAFFFGFTNCDDICPTTMADLAAARRTLPSGLANRVSLVFITVDPQRDRPQVLRQWLDQFDPAIVGLRGPTAEVNRAERSLYSTESEKAPTSPTEATTHDQPAGSDAPEAHGHGSTEQYDMNHSSVVYLFGPNGDTVIYTSSATPAAYAEDMATLLRQS